MLGKGGFGKVYEVVEQHTGRVYACKVIAQAALAKPRQRKKLTSEVEIHSIVSDAAMAVTASGGGSGVVRFERFFADDDQAYLLMELCTQGTVLSMLKQRGRIQEAECRFWIAQLVAAMRLIHSQLVIHRDLKLGNLFIQHDMRLRVGDFGLAAKLECADERKRTMCGTPNYIAPEVLDQHGKGHSFQADVWSIGVIMYTLLVGCPPFETKDVQCTYERIKRVKYSFPGDKPVSSEARALVGEILKLNPAERLSLDQIMAHPWFAQPVPQSLPTHALKIEPALPCSPTKRARYQPPPPSPQRTKTKEAPAPTAATTTASTVPATAIGEEPENNPNNHVQKLPKPMSPAKHARILAIAGTRKPGLQEVAHNLQRLGGPDAIPDPSAPAPTVPV
jgi:polo-like kinase 1